MQNSLLGFLLEVTFPVYASLVLSDTLLPSITEEKVTWSGSYCSHSKSDSSLLYVDRTIKSTKTSQSL